MSSEYLHLIQSSLSEKLGIVSLVTDEFLRFEAGVFSGRITDIGIDYQITRVSTVQQAILFKTKKLIKISWLQSNNKERMQYRTIVG